MYLKEIGCKDARLKELTQESAHCANFGIGSVEPLASDTRDLGIVCTCHNPLLSVLTIIGNIL
jgi:hypothetical protein